jgi:hypothetical protein
MLQDSKVLTSNAVFHQIIKLFPDSPSLLPPAAKNLFEKRFLDFQKLFIGMVWILFFSLCHFVCLCG